MVFNILTQSGASSFGIIVKDVPYSLNENLLITLSYKCISCLMQTYLLGCFEMTMFCHLCIVEMQSAIWETHGYIEKEGRNFLPRDSFPELCL